MPFPRQLVAQLRELYRHTGNSRYLFSEQDWKKPSKIGQGLVNLLKDKTFAKIL